MNALPRNTILVGDALTRLRTLPAASVDVVITSPPYYQLRDYGVPGQLGQEVSVAEWVDNLRAVCAELARVLKPGGSLWLNLGDSYSSHRRYGAPPKSLLLAPERLLLALATDGWLTRNKVIWSKTNPMPSSVGDRLNTTYDAVYFLVRSPRYFFDLDAIRLPYVGPVGARVERRESWEGTLSASRDGLARAKRHGYVGGLGSNPGDVWRLNAGRYPGAHFATFPMGLVQRPLLATCPERVCRACGTPWTRPPGRRTVIGRKGRPSGHPDALVRRYGQRWEVTRTLGRLVPGCPCQAGTQPGVVLDPFFGTGTVGVVAREHGRDWLGIELNPAYARLALERLGQPIPAVFWRGGPLVEVAG
jgi:DNA modification methylase